VKLRPWAAAAILSIGCGRHPSHALGGDTKDEKNDTGDLVEFDLSGGAPESQGSGLVLPVPASKTYTGLIREIDRAAKNSATKGYFIKLGGAEVGWAHGEELGLAFEHLREKSGKPIVCYAHALDNRSAWLLGRSCTRIWVSPAGDIDTIGIAGQVVYLKGALDKLKVHADFLHMGRYKSAAEALTQDGPSDEARESLTAVLASIRSTWLETYAAARKGDGLTALMEDGPWGPDEAKKRGLIDAIGYESDARKEAEGLSHTKHLVVAFGNKSTEDSGPDFSEILHVIAGSESATRRPHIAVVPAEGSIAMGSSSPLSESGITESGLRRVIKKLAADDSVKAVVLRIDSPGGSALASDLLWHELMELRKKKPLVASVGDMAASGGYYLACAANKIVSERTSIVGSIGVLGGKIVIDDALAEVGVHAETFPASSASGAASRAAYLSPLSRWDDPTRERVRQEMQSVYELFLSRVAEGRALPIDAVRAVAEGRIWSGVQGLQLHLVDEIGGLGRALEIAQKLASLDSDAPVRVEGAGETMFESLLSGGSSEQAMATAIAAHADPEDHSLLNDVLAPIRPFVSSLAPLLEKEAVVVALPFGLLVK
jgi:protease-4